jgi:hypothetical protein
MEPQSPTTPKATARRSSCSTAGLFYFGPILTEEIIKGTREWLERAAAAKEEGRLAEMAMSPPERSFAESVNLRVAQAVYGAMAKWPPIEPEELLCPAMVFAGSANEAAVSALESRRRVIEAAGIRLLILDGLNHIQEFTEIEKVIPLVLPFIHENR